LSVRIISKIGLYHLAEVKAPEVLNSDSSNENNEEIGKKKTVVLNCHFNFNPMISTKIIQNLSFYMRSWMISFLREERG
jgi:hypothetical protein